MNGSVQKRGDLGRPMRLSLYVVALGVWLSGGLWLLLHHFFVRQGEFGPESNPLETWFLKAHGAFAVAAIWMFGLLWGVHVTKMWPFSWRRWSGGVMASVLAWLTLSGYLLYYVGDDKARSVVSLLHWSIGLAVPVFFLWHRVNFRKQYTKLLSARVRSRNVWETPGKTEPERDQLAVERAASAGVIEDHSAGN